MLPIWCFWEKVKALEGGVGWAGAIETISDDEHDETRVFESHRATESMDNENIAFCDETNAHYFSCGPFMEVLGVIAVT